MVALALPNVFVEQVEWIKNKDFNFCWILLCVSCFLFQWLGLLFPFSVYFLVQSKEFEDVP